MVLSLEHYIFVVFFIYFFNSSRSMVSKAFFRSSFKTLLSVRIIHFFLACKILPVNIGSDPFFSIQLTSKSILNAVKP